jgi:hypothetical protein
MGKRREETAGSRVLEREQDARSRMSERRGATVLPEVDEAAAAVRIEPEAASAGYARNQREQISTRITHPNLPS